MTAILGVAGNAIGGFSSIGHAFYARAQIKEEARLHKFMAEEEYRLRRQSGDRILGRVRAGYSKNKIDPTTGTAADVTAQQAMLVELDALRHRYGFKLAEFDARRRAQEAFIGGIFQGVTQMLSGSSNLASMGGTTAPKIQGPTPQGQIGVQDLSSAIGDPSGTLPGGETFGVIGGATGQGAAPSGASPALWIV